MHIPSMAVNQTSTEFWQFDSEFSLFPYGSPSLRKKDFMNARILMSLHFNSV